MNILLLTNVFPSSEDSQDTTATKVVYYFAQQWKTKGHNLLIINTINILPKLIYKLPNKIKTIIKSKTGYDVIDNIDKISKYANYENFEIIRIKIPKFIPRTLTSDRTVKKIAKSLYIELNNKNFAPDLIISHWESPGAQLLYYLKDYIPVKNSLIFHDLHYIYKYTNKFKKYISKIDSIGARSLYMAKQIKKIMNFQKTPFICHSGVPKQYISDVSDNKFKKINKYIYVGQLIERKNVDTVIKALYNYYSKSKDEYWNLDIVGVGECETSLVNLCKKLNVKKNVNFLGKVDRDFALKLMRESHCFIMVSKGEAFGLVYLEAMASGCIVIGSENEGIDGIIEDGINGFLCPPGDPISLEKKINIINELDNDKINNLYLNSLNTVKEYTDEMVAHNYLKNVQNWIK